MQGALYILATLQATGALIGAGGAVWAELYYFKAMQDGHIDAAEKAHLRVIAHTLRVGMMLLLLSSIGLVLAAFVASEPIQPALSAPYWIQMTLALLIIVLAWALARNRISFWLGSAAGFTAWWFIALLDLGRMQELSFGMALASYVVATVIIAGILSYVRMLMTPEGTLKK